MNSTDRLDKLRDLLYAVDEELGDLREHGDEDDTPGGRF